MDFKYKFKIQLNCTSEFGCVTRWLLLGSDVVHQLSIALLLKNHDGIYALRLGNMALAVLKFRALINYRDLGTSTPDLLFTASFGFLGARLGNFASYITCYLIGHERGLQFEHWYSMGVSGMVARWQ